MRTSRYSAALITRVTVVIDKEDRDEAIKELKSRRFAIVSELTDENGQHRITAVRTIGAWQGDDYLLNDHVVERANLAKEFEVARDNAKLLGNVLNVPL